MVQSRIYPIIAGIYDYIFFSFVIGAVAGLTSYFLSRPISLSMTILLIASPLALSVLYHLLLARRVTWLSPGELTVGRVLYQNEKAWVNPYERNRWALFLVILIVLLLAGNTWDILSFSSMFQYVFGLWVIIPRVFWLILLSYGVISMGRGRLRGTVLVSVYYIRSIRQLLALRAAPIDQEYVTTFTAGFVALAIVTALVGLAYHGMRRPGYGSD
ncbi:MAG TPA: hypothetical protein VER55_01185 [Ardenticatenaceae bacterium]|nr:hypothetical protein [Ardenticatenaceae bacterium]